jgi:TolB-like protein/Tfp pilus assembly protein PilF
MRTILDTISRLKGPIIALGTVGAVLSGFAGYWNTYRTVRENIVSAPTSPSTPDRAFAALPGGAEPLSIVVLPFSSVEAEAAKVMADGLTVSITSDLGRIRDLNIASPQTAVAYGDKKLTAKQIGTELGVRYVLRGNVQSVGTKIRISAQLTDTSTDTQVWSETFDGDTSDLFALQDKVTILIGSGMGQELIIRAARDSEKRKANPTLSDLVLRARASELKQQTVENLEASAALWRDILKIDSNHVEATISLARTLANEAGNFFWSWDANSRAQKRTEASELFQRAIKLDPENPKIAEYSYTLNARDVDDNEAIAAAKRVVELNPNSSIAWNFFGLAYLHQLDSQHATEYFLKALALIPRSPDSIVASNLSTAAFMANDFDGAIGWATKAREINPKNPFIYRNLAAAYAAKGQKAQAGAMVQKALALDPDYSISREHTRITETYRQKYATWFQDKMAPAMRLAGFPD